MEDDVACSREIAFASSSQQSLVTLAHEFFGLAVKIDEVWRVYTQRNVKLCGCCFDGCACFIGDANALNPGNFQVIQS